MPCDIPAVGPIAKMPVCCGMKLDRTGQFLGTCFMCHREYDFTLLIAERNKRVARENSHD